MDIKVDWDKQAASYQSVFKGGINDYNKKLMGFFCRELGLKAGDRVIDIGCGVGKYGTYFASMGCDVTLTDISGEMLRHARENMAPFSVPCSFLQADFDEADISQPIFSPPFKLAISTMSPAVHDVSGVKKMSAITEGFCFISRFMSWQQPARDEFYRLSGTEPLHRMDNARLAADAESMAETVRQAGYRPILRTEDYNWLDKRSPMEAARRFAGPDAGQEQLQRALETVEKLLQPDGLFHDGVRTKTAWIYWEA